MEFERRQKLVTFKVCQMPERSQVEVCSCLGEEGEEGEEKREERREERGERSNYLDACQLYPLMFQLFNETR
jgi:hypothetical protein